MKKQPMIQALIDRSILARIGKALIDYTNAGAVVCAVNDGKSEFFFPIQRDDSEPVGELNEAVSLSEVYFGMIVVGMKRCGQCIQA